MAIAHALAMSPKAMLFDEPTSALDPEMTRELLAVVHELAGEGMTLVIATHEMGFAREVADRLLFIDQARRGAGATRTGVGSPREERTRRFLAQVL